MNMVEVMVGRDDGPTEVATAKTQTNLQWIYTHIYIEILDKILNNILELAKSDFYKVLCIV